MITDKKDIITTQEDILRSNRNILSEHYDIGQLVRQAQIDRGYINDSYKIDLVSLLDTAQELRKQKSGMNIFCCMNCRQENLRFPRG